MLSVSKKDRCVVTLLFESGTNMKAAGSDIHERLERAVPRLPPEIEKPVIARYEESDAPVYMAALTSARLSAEEIRELVDRHIKDRILRVDGVANVEVGGGRESKILAEVDRDRLLAHGLSVHRIVQALARRNVAVQAGALREGTRASAVRLLGTLRSLEDLRNIVVARDPSGGTVLLRQVAEVSRSPLESESLSRLNGRAAVSFYVQKESSANTVRVVDGVHEALEQAWKSLRPGVRRSLDRVVVSDHAANIRAAMGSVRLSLWLGMVLIVLVLCAAESNRPATRRAAVAGLGFLIAILSVFAVVGIPQGVLEWPLAAAAGVFLVWAVRRPDVRPALVVGATIPLSLLICFMLFQMSGVTLNIMTLFGLALGVGLLVDNAIVVYESMAAARQAGRTAEQDSAKAVEGVVLPLAGSTLTTVVVFVPLLFISEDIRRLYTDVGAAVVASLFASLAVSLTVVPLLIVRFCPPAPAPALSAPGSGTAAGPPFPWPRVWHAAAGGLASLLSRVRSLRGRAMSSSAYRQAAFRLQRISGLWAFFLLFIVFWLAGFKGPAKAAFCVFAAAGVALGFSAFGHYSRHWPGILSCRFRILGAAGLATVAAGLVLARGLEWDFQSTGDLDEFTIFVEMSSGLKLSRADRIAREVETRIQQDPDVAPAVKSLVSRVEGWSSKVFVTLQPRRQRRLSTQEVIDRLRIRLHDVGRDVDENAFVHFSGRGSGREITLEILGPDYTVLEALAQQAAAGLEAIRGLEDVTLRYRPGRPEVRAEVDPEKAARHGLTAEEVVETVHALVRGLRATLFRSEGLQTEVIVRLSRSDTEGLSSLADVPVLSRRGRQVRLGHVARLDMDTMPNEVYRRNKQRMIQVTANRVRLSLGRAAEEIQKVLNGMTFPLQYSGALSEDTEALRAGLRQMAWGVAVTIALVYLVLVVLFESLLEPFLIMTAVPLSLVGAVLGLSLLRIPVSAGVLVGLMMLAGIVVNNAIMWIDRLKSLPGPETPETMGQRLLDAGRSRMRAIFLTTGTTVLGFFPMMMDVSESGALWRPLSVTLVFGLAASTVLTLYVLPCLTYVVRRDIPTFFERLHTRHGRLP
jgi:hydrophobic/amphiphilic exporter-1 (mainly G- bacteria), HAE1 family